MDAAAEGGACDFFEEPVEMLGAEAEKDEEFVSDMGPGTGRSQSQTDAEEMSASRSVSRHYLHRHERLPSRGRNSGHHGSLGSELAHLLHVCLGHYLEPGGASPGVSGFAR